MKNILPPQPKEKETGDDCLIKVKSALSANGIVVPDEAFDRAHRIGKRQVTEKYGEQQSIIVRFTSWRERARVYRERKTGDTPLVMAVDLTKYRSVLLSDIRRLIGKYEDAEFVFADVNCNICIKFKDSFKYVDDIASAKVLCDRFGGAKNEDDVSEDEDEEEETDDDDA